MIDKGALTAITLYIPCIFNLFPSKISKQKTSAGSDLIFSFALLSFFTLLKDYIRVVMGLLSTIIFYLLIVLTFV